jgi:hypothetical protein
MIKRIPVFALLLVVFTLTAAAQTATRSCTARFFVTGSSTRLHLALTATSCATPVQCCDEQADQLKRDCEWRGEDGGSAYSSCRCQSTRYRRDCYEQAGYYYYGQIVMEINPECFGVQ